MAAYVRARNVLLFCIMMVMCAGRALCRQARRCLAPRFALCLSCWRCAMSARSALSGRRGDRINISILQRAAAGKVRCATYNATGILAATVAASGDYSQPLQLMTYCLPSYSAAQL